MAKAKKVKKTPGVRFFREPEIKIVRMGREMVYRGAYAKVDLNAERIELTKAETNMNEIELTADRMSIEVEKNRMTAQGQVKVREAGVHLEGEEATAQPSLTGLRFRGKFRLYTDDRDAAEELIRSGKL